jgi:hypothetical protein
MSAMMDRLLGPFRSLTRAATARVDYFALYSAIVNTDNGDETCDLTPEDSRLPTMQGIPKMYGVPGATSTLEQGGKVLICFQNGDPSKPAIVLFGKPSPGRLKLDVTSETDITGSPLKLNSGSTPVAKEGSSTTGHTHTITGTAGPYPIAATAAVATDTIATGAGSSTVLVP